MVDRTIDGIGAGDSQLENWELREIVVEIVRMQAEAAEAMQLWA